MGWRAPAGRWSASDGEAMVAAFEASGLTMRAFGLEHGVGAHRVSYWREKLRGSGEVQPRGGFVALPIGGGSAGLSGERSVEVTLRNGRTLALRGDWDAGSIRTWVNALEAAL